MAVTILDGRYRLIEPLGSGGVGEVWLAQDLRGGAEVAVKLLRELHSDNAKLAERFAREGRILERVVSPHVCRVLDAGVDGTTPYLVMERIEGTVLANMIKGGRALPWMQTMRIMDDVLDGLAAVHAIDVVHRDLKPSNVMIEPDGRARLIDFGISKLAAHGEAALTSTFATLGTPQYMAPEQLDTSAQVDFAADIYAAGTMFFRLLTGKLPFDTNNPAQLLVLKRHVDAPTLSDRTGTEWPDLLEGLLARMLALAPADRPRDGAKALAALRRVSEELGNFEAPSTTDETGGPVSSEAQTPVLPRRKR